jgi:hypothetical protein
MPSAFQSRHQPEAPAGTASSARRKIAAPMKSAAQANIWAIGGRTGESTQIATPRSSTPKNLRTPVIQAPARGRSAPSDTPTTSSGTPMPSAIAKSAAPPSSTSRVCEM